MSLKIESYKLVGRTYLGCLLDQTNENCCCSNCTFCVRGKLIQAELFKNGYQTFNKDVKCWKISEYANSLSISPCDQWFFAAVLAFGEIKGYLSLFCCASCKLLYALSLHRFSLKEKNLVDLFWPYFKKMRLFQPNALDPFKKEYIWSFRDYKNGTDFSMTLQEVIDWTDELIRLNGEEIYCQFRF